MRKHLVLFCCALAGACLLPRSLARDTRDVLIVWNVGQGQWLTWITHDSCLHFDMGGEKMEWTQLLKLCRRKENRAYFSHWDQDHIGFLKQARRQLPKLCLAAAPGGETKSKRKLALFDGLPACSHYSFDVAEIDRFRRQLASKASSNEMSRVFQIASRFVVPGDSDQKAERRWAPYATPFARWLVLGHHGSRTSTSEFLLKNLPALKLAIASARKSRYGHPHFETLQKLKEHGIAVLSTEDWGSIELETR